MQLGIGRCRSQNQVSAQRRSEWHAAEPMQNRASCVLGALEEPVRRRWSTDTGHS